MRATRAALSKFSRPSQLWRGYSALVARNLPFTAMQFPLFESLKETLIERQKQHGKGGLRTDLTLLERGVVTGVAAGASGSLSAVLTTPIDVVKTRIMLSAAGEGSAEPEQAKQVSKTELERARKTGTGRKTMWAVGKEVWRQEGIRGLFRGGWLRASWTALGSGLYLSVYESGRRWLESRREEKAF